MQCPYCNGTGNLPSERETVGAMVVAMRNIKGITQQQLAEASNLSRGQIANIEVDRTDIPLKTLKRLADGLGCKMRELVP